MGDDSSPDLSLKLRRGSSDSRDSFYLDLDKGIDSDIEEVATTSAADGGDVTATPTITGGLSILQETSWPTIPPQNMSGGSKSTAEEPHMTSMASPSGIIASAESFSHPSYPAQFDKHSVKVQIHSSTTKVEPLAVTPLNLYTPYNLNRRLSRVEKQNEWRQLGTDALTTTLSALYGKLLVVMGTAFPMAEVISTYVPPSFYEAYYIYLYCGSMLFLFYMSCVILREKRKRKEEEMKEKETTKDCESTISGEESDEASGESLSTVSYRHRKTSSPIEDPKQHHYGSFYLRMGAVAFGIGSMIYSGLEFGQYFELESNTKCHNIFIALTPITRMAFIFIQMYFIFLNNEMGFCKSKVMAKFGLMHMIGTNLSVWLNVLVQETKHEILTFYNPENNSLRISHRIPYKSDILLGLPAVRIDHSPEVHGHHIVTRGLKGPHHLYECRRTNIIGSLVQDASPFLFPCTIEYSLICAAILYVMWRNISKLPVLGSAAKAKEEALTSYKKSPHHYSVDCARAHKGLFVGILLLVLTIISLILFFVLISRPEFVGLAVVEVNICELTIYGLTTFASLIGMWQVRQLKYDGSKNLHLDNILLVGAQTGMFIYSTFTIIGGQFTIQRNTVLVLVTALTSLLQTTCQTIFILDASRRTCATSEQIKKKPGRQIVTFLLVTNLAMWAINTLEKSRAESHPIQLHFYGLWAWTIITHAAMPLAIFYRFHSTVCLCEIWKRAYKMKPTYM
ncbi:proton channel OtopLc-like isoform X2 [Harmonia axyridis]|uniref:proton channel OtopLc-like isoform X2 n=1 Tax=Harmonia axyridis TaxID=115357 RepID=UPI001E278177|nr:proton channel OtopLc-like isoform X2 [Harmonia axyridis]